MGDRSRGRPSRLADVLPSMMVLLCGVWLIAAALVLGYEGTDFEGHRNDVVTGGLLAILALFRILAGAVSAPVGLVIAALGGWLVVAPFALGYPDGLGTRAAWNDIAVGVVVIASSLAGWRISRRRWGDI